MQPSYQKKPNAHGRSPSEMYCYSGFWKITPRTPIRDPRPRRPPRTAPRKTRSANAERNSEQFERASPRSTTQHFYSLNVVFAAAPCWRGNECWNFLVRKLAGRSVLIEWVTFAEFRPRCERQCEFCVARCWLMEADALKDQTAKERNQRSTKVVGSTRRIQLHCVMALLNQLNWTSSNAEDKPQFATVDWGATAFNVFICHFAGNQCRSQLSCRYYAPSKIQ